MNDFIVIHTKFGYINNTVAYGMDGRMVGVGGIIYKYLCLTILQ